MLLELEGQGYLKEALRADRGQSPQAGSAGPALRLSGSHGLTPRLTGIAGPGQAHGAAGVSLISFNSAGLPSTQLPPARGVGVLPSYGIYSLSFSAMGYTLALLRGCPGGRQLPHTPPGAPAITRRPPPRPGAWESGGRGPRGPPGPGSSWSGARAARWGCAAPTRGGPRRRCPRWRP
jgi:hypothetical protein